VGPRLVERSPHHLEPVVPVALEVRIGPHAQEVGDHALASGITGEVTVPKDYGNLTHGYCVTSHAAQGKTVDRVFIAQSAQSFRASSREQFYVSVSRGRESVTIFTDDKIRLKARIMESSARTSATELQRSRERQQSRHMQRHVQRTQRLIQAARAWARAQAARLMQQRAAVSRSMRRERDGPERHL